MNVERKTNWVLATLALLVPLLCTWSGWVTYELFHLRGELRIETIDRFTTSMFIDVQAKLAEKNPDGDWLSPSEVRAIQRSNPPYLESPRRR